MTWPMENRPEHFKRRGPTTVGDQARHVVGLLDMGEEVSVETQRKLARDVLALEILVRRASVFINAVAVMADNKGPSLGWLAQAEIVMPGEIIGDPDGPIHEESVDE